MTTYEFLALETDHALLHGLRTKTEFRPCAIHVHGTWGNFYENTFALQLSETYLHAGWSYASVNTVGHDGGSMHEDFDASLSELDAWVKHLSPAGERVILQGHSMGALKVLQLLHDSAYAELKTRISAVVLLSPFDLVAFNGGVGEELQLRRAQAERLRELNGGASLIPTDIFDAWPLSVDTYLEATTEGGRWDLFPTREKSAGALRSTSVPTFVGIGGEDFAAYPNVMAVADLVSQQVPEATLAIVDGAPHNFAGHEDSLAQRIATFLDSLDSR